MRKRSVIIFILSAVLLISSLLMPSVVMAVRDASLSRSRETVSMDEVELSLFSQLTDMEKLELAGDNSVTVIPLETGRSLTRAEAIKHLDKSLADLGFDNVGERTFSAEVQLRVSGDGSSIVVWRISESWPEMDARALIDDDSGALLAFSLVLYPEPRSEAATDSATPGAAVGEPDMDPQFPEADAADVEAEDAAALRSFRRMAENFLAPFGLDFDIITVEDVGSVLVHVSGGDSRYYMPATIIVTDEWSRIGINGSNI